MKRRNFIKKTTAGVVAAMAVPTVVMARDMNSPAKRKTDSLLEFVTHAQPNWTMGDHHKVICDQLEAVERGDINRLIITVPPRHSKTSLSIYFAAWYLNRNPDKHFLYGTYWSELAARVAGDVRGLCKDANGSAQSYWRIGGQGGSFKAIGVRGAMYAYITDIALLDDPNTEQEYNQALDGDLSSFDKAYEWYKVAFRTTLSHGGAVVIIASRVHEDDLIGRCLNQKNENWQHYKFPAILASGKPLWPEWWPIEQLERTRSELDSNRWNAFCQQNPQPLLIS